jgi:hypothetical protein
MLGERLVAGALLAGERPRQLEERERIASRRLDDLIAPGRKRVPGRRRFRKARQRRAPWEVGPPGTPSGVAADLDARDATTESP